MASAVDICNIAMSHLGNRARIVSIVPPDGSAEADLCALFYRIALLETLEMTDWTFARARVALSLLVDNPSATWAFAYTMPSDLVQPRRILADTPAGYDQDGEKFDVEDTTLYTNKEDAVLLYTRAITNTARFTPGFVAALGYKLAAYAAGPIIKGSDGAKTAQSFHKMAAAAVAAATASDSSRTELNTEVYPSLIAARNGVQGSTQPSTDAAYYGSGYAIL